MRSPFRFPMTVSPAARRRLALGLVAALAVPGCGHEEKSHYTSASKPPTVRVIQPEQRTIVRVVGQPSFIEAYERTSVFPKLTAYIDEWFVDIGDKVKKGDTLARLFIPELVEDYGTKKATVKLDEERVALKKELVEVADADVKAAKAALDEAKAILAKFQSEVDRWDTEVKRLKDEVRRGVVDPQILLESTNQWRSATAARDAAKATIAKADAELLSKKATLAEAKVDVQVAEAALEVATSEWKRIGALVGYLTLPAPFDGIIFARNANTLDFVLPSSGDPTADPHSPGLSPSGAAAPVYIVDRTDIVRVFVDIPERDANYVHGVDLRLVSNAKPADLPKAGRDLITLARMDGVLHIQIFDDKGKQVVNTDEKQLADKSQKLKELKALLEKHWDNHKKPSDGGDAVVEAWKAKVTGEKLLRISPIDQDQVRAAIADLLGPDRVPTGTRASVLVRGFRDEPIPGTVTRTSWALNIKSRTLRAEIDLKNPNSQLLPGMYAYAKVIIDRPGVEALPLDALTYSGDQTFCWLYKDGRAVRTEVQTGVSDGRWIEVTNFQHQSSDGTDYPWTPVTGTEKVILGDLTMLADGTPVEVAPEREEGKVAEKGSGDRPAEPNPGELARRSNTAPDR